MFRFKLANSSLPFFNWQAF